MKTISLKIIVLALLTNTFTCFSIIIDLQIQSLCKIENALINIKKQEDEHFRNIETSIEKEFENADVYIS